MSVFWITAFFDLPADRFEAGARFWRGVTGFGLSELRGEHAEFGTLVPEHGDDYLRVQRIQAGPGGVHLDLHVNQQTFALEESPGGLTFCWVDEELSAPPPAATWPGGHRSQVDQVCIDIPADQFDAECAFWAQLTGRELQTGSRPEFQVLERPADQPLRILLQRLDGPAERVSAHVDLATDDRPAEVARHQSLGASVEQEMPRWTVLRDPAGLTYCVTDRLPR